MSEKGEKRAWRWVFLGLILSIFIYFIWAKDFTFIYNHGTSMEPTYRNSEFLVVQKRGVLGERWSPSRFDVVIIRDKHNKEDLVKRVIGLPGDTVEIRKGSIYLNKKKLNDPFGSGRIFVQLVDEDDNDLYYWGTREKVVNYIDQKEIIIKKNHVWVIGDNRGISWYGELEIKDIKSLVLF